jgi:c-di-AMP phosphodiesterase-like protein
MRRSLVFFIILILITHVISCKKIPNEQNKEKQKEKIDTLSTSFKRYKKHEVLADTISYGVVIKNKDTTNKWRKKWLKNLNREQFIDQIFNRIYSGELTPYSYFDEKQLSIKDIKSLEEKKEFNRNKIGKLQFKEIWYWNPEKKQMIKEVYSIMFAYERYNSDGSFRGYKPAFKIYLNHSSTKNK